MNRDTASPVVARPTAVRYGVLGFACALSMITYLDRVSIGSATEHIIRVLGLNDVSDMNWAFWSFMIAYAAFEIPSGWLGDVIGPRRTLVRIVLWWSFFTALTALTGWQVAGITFIGFWGLVILNFLFGMGEAGAYPNITRALHNWFPMTHWAKTQGAVWMSGRLMGGLTPLIWFFLLQILGLSWRAPFFIFAAIGACWCIAFFFWFRNRPHEHPQTNAAERELIARGSGDATANAHANVPWLTLLRSRNLWMLCLMYFCMSYPWYFNVYYLPEFLRVQHGVQKDDWLGAFFKGGPLVLGAFGCLTGGMLSDWFIRRTGNHKWGRRIWGMLGHAVCVPCFLACIIAPSAWTFGIIIAISGFFNDLAMGPAWATCQDIGKRHAAIVAGCMNFIGNLGGASSALLIGWILKLAVAFQEARTPGLPHEEISIIGKSLGYDVNFLTFAMLYVVAVVLWLGIDATRPVVPEDETTIAEKSPDKLNEGL
jgi:MFS family permease